MGKTLKAVFVCEALGERMVWWVSNNQQAQRHLHHHINKDNGQRLAKYTKHEWTLTIEEAFGETTEVHYDAVSSWGGK